MTDYDFKALNDKEFESFCVDLLSAVENHRFERFKPGKDAGVDGRYFSDSKKEIILQCKHWSNTPVAQLITKLKKIEKPKLDQLKPHRYLLVVSLPLSRKNKTSIFNALAPHLKSESDIFGLEDINDFLKKHPHIERQHYKLWLANSNVLINIIHNAIIGRSEFELSEIVERSKRYVVTKNHNNALEILENQGVVIITGEPGIGKTTLADHLCLHYVARGFSFLKISDDIKEAESIFDPDSEQIFYFDDFLGRNYLAALNGHEGSNITHFIRRVAHNKNKRFILTSRSTILNQGKFLIDVWDHENIQKNEYELHIRSLSDMDKAQILYNHIWHSELSRKYINQFYKNLQYRDIISNKNFNPRLIQFVTDASRLDTKLSATDYWKYVQSSLDNPSKIWDNPFSVQLDDYERMIVILVAINGLSIEENELLEAYNRYLDLNNNQNFKGRVEFQTNLRLLVGSFLSREISEKTINVDLFNPSIGDYILNRYAKDDRTIKLVMLSLQTSMSLITLNNLKRNNIISYQQAFSICAEMLSHFSKNSFKNLGIYYVSQLCVLYKEWSNCLKIHLIEVMKPAIDFILLNNKPNDVGTQSYKLLSWALQEKIVTNDQALKFIKPHTEKKIYSSDEMREVATLLSILPKDLASEATKSFKENIFKDFINYLVDTYDIFFELNYGEHEEAKELIEQHVENELQELGIDYCADDIDEILKHYDVEYELSQYFENAWENSHQGSSDRVTTLSFTHIDDLFDRG